MNSILWAVPVTAFLTALVLLMRQFHFTVFNELVGEPLRKAQSFGAAGAEAPPPAASPEPEAPGFRGFVSSRSDSSAAAAERGHDPLSRENLEPLCRKFSIREISLLPSTRRAGVRAGANLEILVEFEFHARVDYSVFFGLRQELFMLLGRQVDLVCKNSADLEGQRGVFARAHVLYAA